MIIQLIFLSIVIGTILQFILSKNVFQLIPLEYHLPRRLQHAGSGVFIYLLSYTDLKKNMLANVLLLYFYALLMFLTHRLRLSNDRVRNFLAKAFAPILRQRELEGDIPGAFFFVLGLATSALIVYRFSNDNHGLTAWRLGLLYLSFGDPLAGIVGSYFSKKKSGKSFHGSLACFFTCAFLTGYENKFEFYTCFLGGIIGMLAEAMPSSWIDDNFLLPVFSTSVILFLHYLQLFELEASL